MFKQIKYIHIIISLICNEQSFKQDRFPSKDSVLCFYHIQDLCKIRITAGFFQFLDPNCIHSTESFDWIFFQDLDRRSRPFHMILLKIPRILHKILRSCHGECRNLSHLRSE